MLFLKLQGVTLELRTIYWLCRYTQSEHCGGLFCLELELGGVRLELRTIYWLCRYTQSEHCGGHLRRSSLLRAWCW